MNKTCARCEKTVYPTEELKCLDKVWHKGCFKCQECGMTLNMRTYKGYGKLPYCESHVPKAKHTTMAETPELKRIAENTKIQSNVKYHADFEKSKGKFTQVADDPETLRIKANTKIISNVAYHGDLEKKAHMERQRLINEDGEVLEVQPDNYHQQIETYASEMLPTPLAPKEQYYKPSQEYYPAQTHNHNQGHHGQLPAIHGQYQQHTVQSNHQNTQVQHQNAHPHQNSQHLHQNPQQHHHNSHQHQNAQHHHQNAQPVQQNVQPVHQNVQQHQNTQQLQSNHNYNQKYDNYNYYGQYQQGNNYGMGQIGRIQDYDPVSDGPRQLPNTQRATTTLIYNSTNEGRGKAQQNVQNVQNQQHHQIQNQNRNIGRVTDIDPVIDDSAHARHVGSNQKVYIAMYDYEANDSDEVSFREGDLISNVTSIDSGWMTGQVLRTGHTGMLPANYVEVAPNVRN